MTMTGTGRSKRNAGLLVLSVIGFLFFLFLVVSTQYKYDNTAIGVVRELLTLPFAAILLTVLIMSVVTLFKGKFELLSYPFFTIVIIMATIIMLTVYA